MKKDLLPAPINEVYLRGRVSGEAVTKVLPSGDEVVEFRIVIPRIDQTAILANRIWGGK